MASMDVDFGAHAIRTLADIDSHDCDPEPKRCARFDKPQKQNFYQLRTSFFPASALSFNPSRCVVCSGDVTNHPRMCATCHARVCENCADEYALQKGTTICTHCVRAGRIDEVMQRMQASA